MFTKYTDGIVHIVDQLCQTKTEKIKLKLKLKQMKKTKNYDVHVLM